jgi:hypothetical protein
MAEMNPIKFSKDLQKVLFPDNSFYKKSKVEGGIGADVTKVEIPIAGIIPSAKSGDPATLPLQVTEREDDVKEYAVEQIYVPPVLVRHENEIVTNYGKRQDVISQFADAINTRVADIAAVNWGTAGGGANIVRTTGTTSRATDLVNGTGNRKRVIYDDLVNVNSLFNKMNLPAGGARFALWTPAMLEDLFLIDKLTDAEKVQIANIRNGMVGTIFGFTSMMRWNETKGSNGLVYSVDAAIKRTIDEANVATDNAAALFWHSGLVRHAEGNAKTIINRDVAGYLGGTVIEAVVRFGATQSRKDGKGVVSLVETNA